MRRGRTQHLVPALAEADTPSPSSTSTLFLVRTFYFPVERRRLSEAAINLPTTLSQPVRTGTTRCCKKKKKKRSRNGRLPETKPTGSFTTILQRASCPNWCRRLTEAPRTKPRRKNQRLARSSPYHRGAAQGKRRGQSFLERKETSNNLHARAQSEKKRSKCQERNKREKEPFASPNCKGTAKRCHQVGASENRWAGGVRGQNSASEIQSEGNDASPHTWYPEVSASLRELDARCTTDLLLIGHADICCFYAVHFNCWRRRVLFARPKIVPKKGRVLQGRGLSLFSFG